MAVKIIYGIIAAVSVLLILGYYYQIKNKDVWFYVLYGAVAVVNTGYLMLAMSNSLEMALWGNRLAYLGSVFLPMSMFMLVLNVCRISYGKRLISMLLGLSVIIFGITASAGVFDWYYKEVSFAYINGAAKLIKTYGPLHNLYYIYLMGYMMTMIFVIIYSTRKKKIESIKHAILLVGVVSGNILIWFTEQLIKVDFEFLSISYIITEVFLLLLYGLLQEQEANRAVMMENVELEKKEFSFEDYYENCPKLESLTMRERDVLLLIMKDKSRKEIAEELFVTENTVKKHTSNIFLKLDVSSRKELYGKVGYKP